MTFINATLSDVKVANKIYWDEILLRTHFASITSIMRNSKWLDGILYSIESSNYTLFAASLRGFLESVTDSYFTLSQPLDLASNFKNIKLAIEGNLNRIFQSDQLEEKLIHFQFASKSNDSGFTFNDSLSASKYIKLFDQESDITTKELYNYICSIVHPAEESIVSFYRNVRESEAFEYSTTDTYLDDQYIDNILNEYEKVIINLLKLSINPPVLCLKILNHFDYELVRSDYLKSCLVYNFIRDEVWDEILVKVEESYDL